MSVINVKHLSVSYGLHAAITRVDFECREGEFVGFVGKSGAGKSSFLNAVAGFVPYQGDVSVPAPIGYVFQDYALYPWMTVQQNIGFGISGMPRSIRRRRVGEMLDRIDMIEFAHRYPHDLSCGQAQRVALARALAPDPAVLMMDEPYGALDHHTRERMQDWLLSIWQESGKTVLFVTHDIEEALFLADRLIIVHDHKFVKDIAVPFGRPRQSSVRFQEGFLDLKQVVLHHMENGADV